MIGTIIYLFSLSIRALKYWYLFNRAGHQFSIRATAAIVIFTSIFAFYSPLWLTELLKLGLFYFLLRNFFLSLISILIVRAIDVFTGTFFLLLGPNSSEPRASSYTFFVSSFAILLFLSAISAMNSQLQTWAINNSRSTFSPLVLRVGVLSNNIQSLISPHSLLVLFGLSFGCWGLDLISLTAFFNVPLNLSTLDSWLSLAANKIWSSEVDGSSAMFPTRDLIQFYIYSSIGATILIFPMFLLNFAKRIKWLKKH